jgi:O-antigen/teichoic acid export membrane protein
MPAESSLNGTVPLPLSARVLRLGASLLRGKRPVFTLFQAVGAQVLIAGINILTGIITARLLGPEGRGIFTAVTTWPQLLATLAFSGLNSAVVLRMRKAPEEAGRIGGGALLIVLAHAAIAIAAGWLLLPLFIGGYPAWVLWFARLCLISVLGNSIYMLMKQSFSGVGAFSEFNLANILSQLLYLVVLLVLIPFSAVTASSASLALLGGGALALFTMLPKFLRLVRPRFSGTLTEMRRLSSFWARAVVMDMVAALATFADRIVLIPMLTASELGFYAVAYSFSRTIQLVQPAITSVIFSHMAGQSESGGKQLHDYTLRFLLAGLVAGVAVLWAAGEPLLVFTYGAEFGAAKAVFRLLLVEASLGALSQVTMQLFLSRDRPGVVSTIQAVVLSVSVVALLVLVPRYGALGAAAGLLIAGTVRWILLLGSVKFILRLPPPRLHLGRDDFQYLLRRLR